MRTISCIKNIFANAVAKDCSEMGCKLRLNGLHNHVVLKGEQICTSRKMCDCIIFATNKRIIIGIVELKSKTAHPSEIIEKLTNSSEVALSTLEKCRRNFTRLDFYHIVLCKGWDSSEHRVITSRRIVVRGKKYDIIPKRCGVSFSEVISSLR